MSANVGMTDGLDILVSQALPKLCQRFHLRYTLPSEIYPISYSPKQIEALAKKRREVLATLFRNNKVTWWDVFRSSEIGEERERIASKTVPTRSKVLDVGSGRGYFTFACTKKTNRVVSLDPMNSKSRSGWWKEFRTTAELLHVSGKLTGLRASATSLPFNSGSFDVVASVHSLRNFRSLSEIREFFREAFRVLRRNGSIVLVESDTHHTNCQAYKAFYDIRTRLGWELGLPTVSRLSKWLSLTGFKEITSKEVDFGLRYAPVYFPFDPNKMQPLKKQYVRASKLLKEQGDEHPPVFMLTARR